MVCCAGVLRVLVRSDVVVLVCCSGCGAIGVPDVLCLRCLLCVCCLQWWVGADMMWWLCCDWCVVLLGALCCAGVLAVCSVVLDVRAAMVTTWCDALYLMRVPLNMHLTAFTPSHIASCPPPLSPEIVVGHLGSTHGLVPLERNSHDASLMQ